MYPPIQEHRRELWQRSYPTTICVLLSIFQMILSLVIVGCESANLFIHFPRMNAFVGFWTYPFFMCAWISLAGASCCCRIRCCGKATLVFQCFSIIMSFCVIALDSYFLANPLQCFFSNYCDWNYYYDISNLSTLYGIKVPLIQGQLSAGVLMFVSCFIYIIIFIKTTSRVSQGITIQNGSSIPMGTISTITNYGHPSIVPSYHNTSHINPVNGLSVPLGNAPLVNGTHSISPIHELICPNCRSTLQLSIALKV